MNAVRQQATGVELDPIGALLRSSFGKVFNSTTGTLSNVFRRNPLTLRFQSEKLERAFIIWRTLEQRGRIMSSMFAAALFFLLLGLVNIIIGVVGHKEHSSVDAKVVDADSLILILLGLEILLAGTLSFTFMRGASFSQELRFNNVVMPICASANFLCIGVWYILTPQSDSKFATPLGVLYFHSIAFILAHLVYRLRYSIIAPAMWPALSALIIVSYLVKWPEARSALSYFDFYFKAILALFLFGWVCLACRLGEIQERSLFANLVILQLKASKTLQLLSLSVCV